MEKTKLFAQYIKAANFFPAYAPGVTNWINKMRGVDGHGKAIDFTAVDLKLIRSGLIACKKDLLAELA